MPSPEPPASATDFGDLARRLAGHLALPGDDAFDRLRPPWSPAAGTRPAGVVEALNAQDVVEAVGFARTAGLAVAVQATGHGTAADLDGALVVHTGRMDDCVVHPDGWARVGAGVRWQQVLDEAADAGHGALAGCSPHVGVVGYTTGGGLGPLARTYGLASDTVRAFEIVTGDGVLRRVTAHTEPDLFWAVRGGKGALGVVTALELDLLPVREVYGGALHFDGRDAEKVVHAWAEWTQTLPEQANTSLALLRLPAGPGVPGPLAGRPAVAVRFVWDGDPGEGASWLGELRGVATPALDSVIRLPFRDIGAVHAGPVDPLPAYEASDLLRALPPAAVDALLGAAGPGSDAAHVMVEVRLLGGAVAREPEVPSAVCHRDAAFALLVVGLADRPEPDAVASSADGIRLAMSPWTTGATLPNFSAGTGADRIRRSYDEATLARLVGVAERFDPGHVFRVGHVPQR